MKSFVFAFLILSGCVACAILPMPDLPRVSKAERKARSVLIVSICPGDKQIQIGSGVIYDRRKIVTATHVIKICAEARTAAFLSAAGSTAIALHVRSMSWTTDITVLEPADPAVDFGFSPAPLAVPSRYTIVCSEPQAPKPATHCGPVTDNEYGGQAVVYFRGYVISGNSGAGAWTESGELVGIISMSVHNKESHKVIGGIIMQLSPWAL